MEPMRKIEIAACGAALAVLLIAGWPAPDAAAQEAESARVQTLSEQAKDLGARKDLPMAWRDLDERFDQARKNGASPEAWSALERDARRLVNMASFLAEVRRQRSSLEAVLGRYDQSLREIAALQGVAIDPVASGPALAADLIAKLQRGNLRRQVTADSLAVANRYLEEVVGGRVAAQDSTITALRLQISSLRQKLWETELRAGVAEADRSAAESVLTGKQQREDSVRHIRSTLTPEEGQILLTPEGAIILRLHGIAFGVGSSELRQGQQGLIEKLTGAVKRFPEAAVTVIGHTDDTGGREANLRLSRRRAETVARLLEGELGMPPQSIATDGQGPDQPVALNSTAEGRALNRRIDVVIAPAD